jgi:hypothetical protein
MKLLVPAALHERLRERAGQLDRLTAAIARDVNVWRARLARHRVAIAAVGGGMAGLVFATRWRSMLRLAGVVASASVRAAALSMVARARVERVVQKEWARATRTGS